MSIDNIIEVNEDTFDQDVIDRSIDIPVVVDFWAPWCAPCRVLGPILEKLAKDPDLNFILAKVNVDENPALSMAFQVQSIPTVIAFLDGEAVDDFTGIKPESQIRKFIEELVPSEIDIAITDANSLLAIRQYHEAEKAYREVLDLFPGHPTAMVNLGQTLIAQGKGCEAIGYLQDCIDSRQYTKAQTLLPLAEYLCQIDTAWDDDDDITPLEAQYRQAAYLLKRSNYAAGLDGLIDVLRQDKNYQKGRAKAVILALFELLGEGDDLTQTYRRELASVLF
ncbi:MAG: thioredoxin [Anaerolineae bacterium]|nr:thioredoxin [Anaerolineae bacterium]